MIDYINGLYRDTGKGSGMKGRREGGGGGGRERDCITDIGKGSGMEGEKDDRETETDEEATDMRSSSSQLLTNRSLYILTVSATLHLTIATKAAASQSFQKGRT